jgi:hypothetical protein
VAKEVARRTLTRWQRLHDVAAFRAMWHNDAPYARKLEHWLDLELVEPTAEGGQENEEWYKETHVWGGSFASRG